nr:hypothetical protein [Allomuricauda sp.]
MEVETNKANLVHPKLTSFLEDPIDLQKFKSKKNGRVTTSVTNGLNYYMKPKFKDSIFYAYNFITENIGPNGVNKIIVFKYGPNKHNYKDETEILIEMRIFNKDPDLDKANLIGISKKELELKFGTDYRILDNRIIYSNNNKVLILLLKESRVKSYRYSKLNTEKIDLKLMGQILE